MVQEVNVPLYKFYFEKLFAQIDTEKKGELDLKEFQKLVVNALEHKEELGKLFDKYAEKRKE